MNTDTLTLKINRRVRDLLESSTLAITARAKELKAKGDDVVNFAAGEPDFDTPETIKAAAVEAIKKGFTKYTPSSGTVELREAIAKKFQDDNNLTYKPSQVVVSCGAKHSIYNLIQVLVDEDDEVLIPAPFWVSYTEMVKLAGASFKILPTTAKTQFKITARQLSESLSARSKLLILNSPSNPTGMVYSKEELQAIAQVCVKHNLYVISDEIYEKLIFDSTPYTSIASLGKDIYDLTFTVNGVSKTYAMTGWRIGYAAGNSQVMDCIKKFQDHTTSNPTSISQMAALQALKESPEAVSAMRNIFKSRRDLMTLLFDKIPQVSYVKPQGAFYLFCDFSKLGDSVKMADSILNEMKVAVVPGDGFGAPGFIRLSFATSEERIKEGVKRIADWVNRHK